MVRHGRCRSGGAAWAALAAALASVLWPGAARGVQGGAADAPGLPPAVVPNPDLAVRLAAQFVATAEDGEVNGKRFRGHGLIAAKDMPHVRFISWYGVPRKMLPRFTRLFGVYVNQVSFNPSVSVPREVPGSRGALFWLDCRDYNWNAAAWQAVADRDLYIQEPWVDHEHAEYLRRKLSAPLSGRARRGREMAAPAGRVLRQAVVPAEAVVWGPQLLRDALESDRSPTYYDLLFADYRYRDVEVEGGGAYEEPSRPVERVRTRRRKRLIRARVPGRGRYLHQAPGKTLRELEPGDFYPDRGRVYREEGGRLEEIDPPEPRVVWEKVVEREPARRAGARSLDQAVIRSRFVDFPRDEDDWDHAFGIDRIRALMREKRLDLDFGAVVEGGRDLPGQGSLVALQNRLLVTIQGPYGAAMETYDVRETAGLRDFSESLIFKGQRYRPGRGARAVRDAGELLAYLPNGGQAGLLVNGEGRRIEFADAHFANDTDNRRMNPGVLTYWACARCHAPAGGYIVPRNVMDENARDGIAAKFRDREQRNRFAAFFRQYRARIKGYQDAYLEHLSDLSIQAGPKGAKGWTGRDYAEAIRDFVGWYDDPIDVEQAAAELGMTEAAAKRLCALSPFQRANRLLHGGVVPRRTWEVDVMPNLHVLREYVRNEAGAEERRGRRGRPADKEGGDRP